MRNALMERRKSALQELKNNKYKTVQSQNDGPDRGDRLRL